MCSCGKMLKMYFFIYSFLFTLALGLLCSESDWYEYCNCYKDKLNKFKKKERPFHNLKKKQDSKLEPISLTFDLTGVLRDSVITDSKNSLCYVSCLSFPSTPPNGPWFQTTL